MNEKPIIFQPWKVRKILDWNWATGNMQTRRTLKKNPIDILPMKVPNMWVTLQTRDPNHGRVIGCRYGRPGDLLWVREPLSVEIGDGFSKVELGHFTYKSDDRENLWTKENGFRTVPSIHMPRFAARIFLKIVSVRAERVQDISKEDAKAEGMSHIFTWNPKDPQGARFSDGVYHPYIANYRRVWDQINAARGLSWDSNPYVWVIEYKLDHLGGSNA